MNRFLKSLGILIVSLFLLASGMNVALEHLPTSPHPVKILFTKNGDAVVYVGLISRLAELDRPDASLPDHLQRGKAPVVQYRWL